MRRLEGGGSEGGQEKTGQICCFDAGRLSEFLCQSWCPD